MFLVLKVLQTFTSSFPMESRKTYRVNVTLPDGKIKQMSAYACSQYHAKDLIYTELAKRQPDRRMYTVVKS